MNDDEKVIYFGETDARNKRTKFGIKKHDRSRHMYAIGKTGMGKSTLLENLAVQDILNGDGLAFIDPHGKSADLLLEYIPEHRMKDVIYFAPFDMEYPISFNVMEDVGPERRYLVASGLMSAFKKVWVDAWSARMEYILGNILLALLEYPGSTLISVNRMLTDKDFRKDVVNNISDPSVKSFWVNEYAAYTDKFAAEAAPAIQNKVGQFVANPLIRNIIGQPKSTFDIREIMDNKKILIVNLSKGRVGEANANLLGSMLITKIYLGAMSRADLKERELSQAPNFYMYVDEFQSFANESFADILSEARKYKLNLVIAHQYIEQMSEEVRAAVFGNVGTMCVFRVGATDAEYLEKEFAPHFTAEDLVNLQKYQMYLKLMIDGVTSPPFSAAGMPPIQKPEVNLAKQIIDTSRAQYARPRADIENEIRAWHEMQFGKGSGGGQGGGGQNNSQSAYGPKAYAQGGARAVDQGQGGASERAPNLGGSQSAPHNVQQRASFSAGSSGRNDGRPPSFQAQNQAQGPTPNRFRSQGESANSSLLSSSSLSPSSPSGRRPDTRPDSRPDLRPNIRSDQPDRSASFSRQPPPSGFSASQNSRPPSQSQTSAVPISQSGIPTQADRENKKMTANDRENELRKAISLSYLKEPEPEIKNDDKSPQPQNVAALREALLSVMQGVLPENKNDSISIPENKIEDKGEYKIGQKTEQKSSDSNTSTSSMSSSAQSLPKVSQTVGHKSSFNAYPKSEPFHTLSDRLDHKKQKQHSAPEVSAHPNTNTNIGSNANTSSHAATASSSPTDSLSKQEVPPDQLENIFNE